MIARHSVRYAKATKNMTRELRLKMTSSTMTREYLTDIKFRNAVKRAVTGRVVGKNDYGRGVVIKQADTRDSDPTLFNIRYQYGDYSTESLERQLKLERELTLAGFELLVAEVWEYPEWSERYVWRREA